MSRPHGRADRAREFVRRLWDKAQEDDIFFMAGAISFNLVMAALPLILLAVGLTGFVLSAQVGDPVEAIVALVVGNLPQGAGLGVADLVRRIVTGALQQRTGFTAFGALLFVWMATRLVGTIRVVLREIFDIGQERGIVGGKVFDAQVVIAGAFLLTLNLGTTLFIEAALDRGVMLLHLGRSLAGLAQFLIGYTVPLLSIWALFLVVYRYIPRRRIPWRTALVAATFSAVFHELLKHGFSWYATELADYSTAWGNLATVGVLLFWIYYEAVVFILGGEVAQVYTMRKARSVQVSTPPGGAG
ncbi:MAG TPA: YihY/virulence factor BrkB family protein [Longimicrobiales bacterium]|nr:YihY/virulence factor BrkB family protein [Longimicrobiales bacterium]